MNYLRVLIVAIMTYLGISNHVLRNKVNKLDEELGDARNNIESYQSILSNKQNENRVLKLSIEDFKQSKDSLIQELSKTQDQLKIKNKKLKEVLQSNPLTTIKINRMDSVITCIPEIYNHQDLFITEEKVYRKKYKNWFQRLIHFDFKKDKVESYKIINSNDLIRVLDTRVIKITK